ncbi:unnamed protein product [Caenorhabditis sp. 36 PRJEB53466]|nr:unnamed protein product [Caenorhabditis sp. 36 PRJEB53466]
MDRSAAVEMVSRLPHVPRRMVCNRLAPRELLFVSFQTESCRQEATRLAKRMGLYVLVDVHGRSRSETVLELVLDFRDQETDEKVAEGRVEFVQVPRLHYEVTWPSERQLVVRCPSMDVLTEQLLHLHGLLHSFFEVEFSKVHTSARTPLLALKSMIGEGTVEDLVFGDHANVLVPGHVFNDFLVDVQITDKLEIGVRSDASFDFQKLRSCPPLLKCASADWLTGEHLLSFEFKSVELRGTTVTSRDFNRFLRAWANGSIRNAVQYEFVSEVHNLQIDNVLEGVRAERYDQNKNFSRDIKFIKKFGVHDPSGYSPKFIDMRNAYDIRNVYGQVGSVCVGANFVNFCVWAQPFEALTVLGRLGNLVDRVDRLLQRIDAPTLELAEIAAASFETVSQLEQADPLMFERLGTMGRAAVQGIKDKEACGRTFDDYYN